jgi:multiple sugar transport system substrate-binding protein
MTIRRHILSAAALLAATGAAHAVDIKYVLWDSGQRPAYQQCASDFEKSNPDIKIKISQQGWDEYWTGISTGFISGTAPDVFTNHLAKYPEFAKNNQLVDLAPLIKRDAVKTDIYSNGLFDIWGRDGKQYGLPKDWDTIAFIVNMDVAKKAGVTLADLNNMTWNPKDGGTFEQIVKKLTVDAAGNNATSPKFDKTKVATYGYQNPGSGGMMGQTEWSHFAVSNGFKFQDKPWDGKFYYDDAKLAETIQYIAGLPGKGVSATAEDVSKLGSGGMFMAGKAAMIPEGSWMINHFASNTKFNYAWVPLPKGPTGQRATMFNGLADSIWVGSKNKEQAWKWVKYLGSEACQTVVAKAGVVFPAVKGLPDMVTAVHKAKNIDDSAFLEMAKGKTFLAPIADNGSEVNELMANAIDSVLRGKAQATPALKDANGKVNALFK